MNRTALPVLCAVLSLAAACKREDRPKEPARPILSPPPDAPAGMPPAVPGAQPGMPPGAGGAPTGQIAALEAQAKKNPKDHEAWVQLGNLYFDSHQHQKSIEAYAKALELQPNDANVLTDQGVMYRELKAFDKAIANFEKAMQVDPRHVQSAFNLGVVYAHDLNQPQKAIQAWEAVLQRGPGTPQAMQARQQIDALRQGGAK